MNNQSILRYEGDPSDSIKSGQDVSDLIYGLLDQESFGVLCTQAEGKPYGSVVAFAFATDMEAFFFGTPKQTRKYRNLTQCDRVALVVDSRDKFPNEIEKIEAVTITGSARQIEPGLSFDKLTRLYLVRHPELKSFIDSSSTAFFRIDVEHITYVTQFQIVYHWTPLASG